MLDRYFNVLLVDDEPDVLAMSRLALKRLTLYGLPLRVHTAASKTEAIELLRSHPEGAHVALAIIDVVMETDHAGLELCDFIRGPLGNHVLPLIIRTGQAGKAPERTVIDRYEITGYVNKVEATGARLYSLVKAGVRQYCMAAYPYFASQLLEHVITHMRSAARFQQAVSEGLGALTHTTRGQVESLEDGHCFVSDSFFAGSGPLADSVRARTLLRHLADGPSERLGVKDALWITDDQMMIRVAPSPAFPHGLQSIWSITAPPQPFVIRALYSSTRKLQALLGMLPR